MYIYIYTYICIPTRRLCSLVAVWRPWVTEWDQTPTQKWVKTHFCYLLLLLLLVLNVFIIIIISSSSSSSSSIVIISIIIIIPRVQKWVTTICLSPKEIRKATLQGALIYPSAYMCMCMCVYIYIYIYLYMYTRIYIYVHIYIYIPTRHDYMIYIYIYIYYAKEVEEGAATELSRQQ